MAIGVEPKRLSVGNRLFQSQLAFGQIAESQIARWLLRRGNVLLPIYEKEIDNGKGPRIFYEGGDFVAPDLLVVRGGDGIYWIEAKHKTVFTWHRLTQRWTTGIDRHHYEQYCRVRDSFGFPVWLLFLHESSTPDPRDVAHGCPPKCPTGLFGREINRLRMTENHQHANHGRTGMVYWAHTDLTMLATLDEVRAATK